MPIDRRPVRMRIREIWLKGLRSLPVVMMVAYFSAVLCQTSSFGKLVLGETLPWYWTVVVDLLILAMIILLVPFYLGSQQYRPDFAAEQIEQITPMINDLATRVGLDWNQHWMSHFDALARAGDTSVATREYRDKFGVTWDEALDEIDRWKFNECERKL